MTLILVHKFWSLKEGIGMVSGAFEHGGSSSALYNNTGVYAFSEVKPMQAMVHVVVRLSQRF